MVAGQNDSCNYVYITQPGPTLEQKGPYLPRMQLYHSPIRSAPLRPAAAPSRREGQPPAVQLRQRLVRAEAGLEQRRGNRQPTKWGQQLRDVYRCRGRAIALASLEGVLQPKQHRRGRPCRRCRRRSSARQPRPRRERLQQQTGRQRRSNALRLCRPGPWLSASHSGSEERAGRRLEQRCRPAVGRGGLRRGGLEGQPEPEGVQCGRQVSSQRHRSGR